MTYMPDKLTPERWLDRVFSSGEARLGGIVKRKVSDIEQLVGRDKFEAELQRRGYQAIENGAQFVIFCNHQPIRRVG